VSYLEQELAGVGGVCAVSLMNKHLVLPPPSAPAPNAGEFIHFRSNTSQMIDFTRND